MQKSLAATFFERVQQLDGYPAVRYKGDSNQYQDISWREFGALVREMAFGLAALGLKPSDCAAIFSGNSHLWTAADFATISNGAISVPLYPTCSQSDIEFILSNCEAPILFAQDKLLKRILEGRERLTSLTKIVVFGPCGSQAVIDLGKKFGLSEEDSRSLLMSVDQLRALGRELAARESNLIEQRIAATKLDDNATIIYTSGTTGTPKGAGLSHSIILSVVNDLKKVLPIYSDDVYLSYLPMSHVFERVCGEFYWIQCGGIVAYAESIEAMAKNLAEVQPSMILVVPRVLDRIYAKVKSGIEGASGRARNLIDWAIYVGKEGIRQKAEGKPLSLGLQAKLWFAERIVFHKLREKIGPRLRLVVSGGAPATPHVIEFFNAVGIQTLEGYGLTESAAPATVNRMDKVKIGSVGPALPSVQVKIADDGEILLRGGSIVKSYYRNEAATKEAFENGWFKTGDIGCLDSDGYLRITDRKKDLIVNSAGKNIAPQRIEAILRTIPFVSQAIVFGDKQKSLVALFTLDEHAVSEFAREKNWQCESYQELTHNPELNRFLRKEMQLRSGQLADYEQVRRFAVLPQEFSVESGELTATLKIKRNVIGKQYKDVIDSLYDERSERGERDKKDMAGPEDRYAAKSTRR